MAIVTMSQINAAGDGSEVNLKARTVRWTGDAAYPDAGSAITTILRTTCEDGGVVPVACVPGDCGIYRPIVTETPAVLRTGVAAWPVADQNGNTVIYKLNGGAAVTVTLAGAHTTAAHLATSLNAEAGIHAYDDGTQVTVKTDRTGTGASFQVTGGTANAVYLFSTTAVTGTADKLVKVMTEANVDAGANVVSTDLSATEFNATFLCE
ncbi:MAG: hypothetical protein PHX83_06935 [Acidobacteriia bacterium]|nr:hypothetical protein [Terriglobia bacterium]